MESEDSSSLEFLGSLKDPNENDNDDDEDEQQLD